MSLHDAVAKYVENGDVLATGGFTTNRKPYAAVSEILRQGQKDFIVYAGPGGGEVDMLIGEGRVAAYINCYTANSGYTNVSRRFRAAIEKGQLTYEDYSQDVLMLMLHASSLGLPFLPVRLMQGSGLMKYWGISEEKRKTMPKMEDLKCVEIENPMVPGQKVVAVPVPRIDTALIHVQQASPDGTCIICGDEFHDIDIAVAARKTIVTCEEIVSNEYIRRDPTKTRIFGECAQAVVKAPYGAWPAQCYDYYDDDDAALKEYDKASKYQDKADAVEQLAKAAAKAVKALEKAPADEKLKLAAEAAEKAAKAAAAGELIPETFEDYLNKWVYGCKDQAELLDKIGGSRLMQGSGLMKFWGISEEKRKTMPKIEDLKCAEIENPMVPGQKVVAVPVPKIDTAIIHVQQASPDGTCIICGDEFHDIDIAIAARKTIVTCEEIVSDEFIRRDPTKTRIFGECVQAVVKAPYGAWPSQCYAYYDDDDAGLKEYDKASKYQDAEDAVKQLEKAAVKAAKALEKAPEDEKLKLAAENAQKAFELAKSGEKIPETFKDFLEKWVYSCEDQPALLDKIGGSRLMRLKNEPHLGYSTTH